MSLENKKPIPDLINIEHNDNANAKNILAYGKTTSSTYIPLLLNDDGSIKIEEVINHSDLSDMPDISGTNTDHDNRYLVLDGSNANTDINIGGYSFTTTGTGDFGGDHLRYNTDGSHWIQFTQTTGNDLGAIEADTYFYIKIDGGYVGWFDSSVGFNMYENKGFRFGASGTYHSQLKSTYTQGQGTGTDGHNLYSMYWGLPDQGDTGSYTMANYLILAGDSNVNYDFGHAPQTNPTLFIHSANQNQTQWLGLTHNGTNGLITSGTGEISFNDGNLTTTGNITGNNFYSGNDSGDGYYLDFGSLKNVDTKISLITDDRTTIGADGYSIEIRAGDGGPDDVTSYNGKGGDIEIRAGDAGNSPNNPNSDGGAIKITSGDGDSSNKGGNIELTAGTGGDGEGLILLKTETFFEDNAHIPYDNVKMYFGAGDDAFIYYDGTDLNINPAEVGTGSLTIGDGGITNYLEIKSDGELNLHGTARVLRDLWIDASGIKAPGAKPATEVSHGDLETSAWSFSDEGVEANQQKVSWRTAPPYDMDRSEGVKIRLGWSSASTGNVKWQLEYRWLSEDEDTTQGAEETLTVVDAASTTANGLVVTDITGINAPSSTDASIIFRLTRLSADGQDTISDSVELHGVCFNYVSDKLGEA